MDPPPLEAEPRVSGESLAAARIALGSLVGWVVVVGGRGTGLAGAKRCCALTL